MATWTLNNKKYTIFNMNSLISGHKYAAFSVYFSTHTICANDYGT